MKTAPFGTKGEPMAKHTSLKIGGPAQFYLRVVSERDLVGAVAVAREHELPVFVLGGGTNLLVADQGIAGVVLHNDWAEASVVGTEITASSGTPMASVAAAAARNGILGLEWMATVPGTVGGAVHGNAGAFGSETKDVLIDAELMDLDGRTWTATNADLGFAYRTSALQGTPTIVLRARFRGTAGDRDTAVKRIKEIANERIAKQPLAQPNTGSIFRNPPGDHAGRLIEAAGLKGLTEGGAMVSTKHANFIVNIGDASAQDVKTLMDRCRREVKEKFGVDLVPEVELVGEWPGMREELRVVTVLFVDVTGSTTLAGSTDPDSVRAVLRRYRAIASDVVRLHGGTIEKFGGDAIVAVFGVPQVHRDDADRALTAALALRAAVASDAQTASLALRMGVNTVEVIAAATSAGDLLIADEVAARLQQHAEPATILVGERTRNAVTGFRFSEVQRLAVKGKEEPIVAAKLLEGRPEGRAPWAG
jgi:UDP-N-acetylmuramate dehydrogenase